MNEQETECLPDYSYDRVADRATEQEIRQLASPHFYHFVESSPQYRTKTDNHLVHAYLRGDNQAFNEIVYRHHPTLYRVAKRYATNQADAEDILQEALLRASRYLENYRGECKLRTWLYRLVVNAAYDHTHRSYQHEYVAVDDPEFHNECTKQLSHDPLAHRNRPAPPAMPRLGSPRPLPSRQHPPPRQTVLPPALQNPVPALRPPAAPRRAVTNMPCLCFCPCSH